MCLAIPACITSVDEDRMAEVDILGVAREVSLDLTPAAKVGDYVLVHAGFAIEVVDEQFAQETLDLVRQFPELVDVSPSYGTAEQAAAASGAGTQPASALGGSRSEVRVTSDGETILGTGAALADSPWATGASSSCAAAGA